MKRALIILFAMLLFAMPALAEGELVPLPGPPMDDATWGQLLWGSWCEDPSVGSGYGERWLFTRDELYIIPSQYGEGDAEVSICAWSVADGQLFAGPEDCTTPSELAGPYEVSDDESPYSPKILIGGRTFYQYSPDPVYFEDLADYGIEIAFSMGSPKALD